MALSRQTLRMKNSEDEKRSISKDKPIHTTHCFDIITAGIKLTD